MLFSGLGMFSLALYKEYEKNHFFLLNFGGVQIKLELLINYVILQY